MCEWSPMAFSRYLYWLFFLGVIGLSTASADTLPEFDIDVVLEEDTFYTLPKLEESVLRYNFSSSLDGQPYDTNVTVDVIKGEASSYWEDRDNKLRMAFSPIDAEAGNMVSYLELNTSRLIEEYDMRGDCRDISVYDGFGNHIPHLIERCDDGDTILKFPLDSDQDHINIYFSGPESHEETEAPYTFYDGFANLSISEEDWDILGNITIEEGYAYTGASNESSMNLTWSSVSDTSEIGYRFFASGDSYHNMTLSDTEEDGKRYEVHFYAEDGLIEACRVRSSRDCSRFHVEFAEEWNDFRIDIEKDRLWLYLNDERLNRLRQYHDIDSMALALGFDGMVFLDHFFIIEKAQTSFQKDGKERFLDWISGTALQGDFGFEYDVHGFDSGNYTLATRATRPDLYPQYSFDVFKTHYNRLVFDTVEGGYITEMGGKYLIDTQGTFTISNPNDEPLQVEIDLDTQIMIEEIDGDSIRRGKIDIIIGPFSSETVNYFTTGVTNYPPFRHNKGVLARRLEATMNEDIHEFGRNRFFRDEVVPEDAPLPDPDYEDYRKELRFRVEDGLFVDVFTRMSLYKFVSQRTVEPGDVVDVTLRVRNHDPFSREAELHDMIPEEFELHGDDESEADTLSWSFKMNKHTSRIFSYEMKYVGSSTGRVDVPLANLTSDGLLVYSNDVLLLRDNPGPENLHIVKRFREISAEGLGIDEPVEVTISVTNMGRNTLREVIVDDSDHSSIEFTSPSVSTPYIARWIVPEITSKETWEVSYVTNMGDHVKNEPSLDSYVDDLSYTTDVMRKSPLEAFVDVRTVFSLPVSFLIGLLALMNIMVVLSYVYKNPFFEVEDELTPKIFIVKTYEQIPEASRRIIESQASMMRSKYDKLREHVVKAYSWLKPKIIRAKGNVRKYYRERNISLVKEKSSAALSSGATKINSELSALKKMTLQDWLYLLSRYKKEFFRAIRNRITYSMFSISDRMISKNKDSKLGQILSFSSKVLNPELNEYLSHLADRKLQKKEAAYRREIQNIEDLLDKNRSIAEGKTTLISKVFFPFRKIFNFFKK